MIRKPEIPCGSTSKFDAGYGGPPSGRKTSTGQRVQPARYHASGNAEATNRGRTVGGALIVLVIVFLLSSAAAHAQKLEVGGGYAHITGDLGLDGYNVGGALWFSRRVSMAFGYDSAYDTSKIGTFELTSTGEVAVKSHIQDFLVGPRIYFPGAIKSKKVKYGKRLTPFGELQFGLTHLNTAINQVSVGSKSASDTAFSWMLGGGVDYILAPHWTARVNLGLLRTHLADTGQSRLRLGLGIAYTFGAR